MRPLPYKLAPLEDESPTSWILRLARKYHCDVITFLEYYECAYLLKYSLDVDADLSPLRRFLPVGSNLPTTISEKLVGFRWIKGRSDWLDIPNRKGSTSLNSFTKVCPNCLLTRGYYQLKWKVSLFTSCIQCGVALISNCEQCNKEVSLYQHFKQRDLEIRKPFYFHCSMCTKLFSKMRDIQVSAIIIDSQRKIDRAYSEQPPNWEYLDSISL